MYKQYYMKGVVENGECNLYFKTSVEKTISVEEYETELYPCT